MSKRPPLRPGATRRAYINRTTKPKSSGRPKPRNTKRKAKEFVRCFGSVERVEFVKTLPCAATGFFGTEENPIENAHVCDDGSKGGSRRSGARCIAPLLVAVHRLLHRDPATFRLLYATFDAERAAAETEAKWQAYCAAGAAE